MESKFSIYTIIFNESTVGLDRVPGFSKVWKALTTRPFRCVLYYSGHFYSSSTASRDYVGSIKVTYYADTPQINNESLKTRNAYLHKCAIFPIFSANTELFTK